MGRTAAGSGEFFNLVIINVDSMREPHVVSQPSERFHPVDRAQLKALERVAFLIHGFTQVGVKLDPMPSSKRELSSDRHRVGPLGAATSWSSRRWSRASR